MQVRLKSSCNYLSDVLLDRYDKLVRLGTGFKCQQKMSICVQNMLPLSVISTVLMFNLQAFMLNKIRVNQKLGCFIRDTNYYLPQNTSS